ncbi:helix-turn-helix domain-containing protein [Kaistia terrae]|jgi:ribosome-binding protein aMBF1 (putative translation factor)|uniref:Helix-turn-helix domain-containing protein n=1 Tax=Kaistia terrae TaxID=537017 RepID=A0ABW0PWF4_9HYPH|nr:helix-turn-helix transcriptional regulator [Kaistia terrae]MCX5579266.1 helix-turn-helix transcriptional regulator [Kaistia terrae]
MELRHFRQQPDVGPRDTAGLPSHVLDKIAAGEQPLKAIREWRCISQTDLADRTGVAVTQIMRCESGWLISKEALRLLARGLRVRDDLLTD